MSARRTTPAALLLAGATCVASLLGGCRTAPRAPRPRAAHPPVPVGMRGEALLAATVEQGLGAHLVGTGRTTGHVFTLDLENPTDTMQQVDWRGSLAVGDPDAGHRTQWVLAFARIRSSVPPGARRRLPVYGFCLDPGRPPIPRGTRTPLEAALLRGHRARVPVADGTVRVGADRLRVLRVPAGGILAAPPELAGVGRPHLLDHDGRLWTLEATPGSIAVPAGLPGGLVRALDGQGTTLGRFVLTRESGDAITVPVIPGGGDHPEPFPPELGLRLRLAEQVVVEAPDVDRDAGVGRIDHPDTTIAQQAVWSLAGPEAAETPPGERRDAVAEAVEASAAEAVARADEALREEFDVLFSLVDLTRK